MMSETPRTTYYVKAVWDAEAEVFYAETDIPGLNVEGATMAEFFQAVGDALIDLFGEPQPMTNPDMAAKLAEALRLLTDAAHGLSFGSDWNNGTHAKLHGYRERLLDALPIAAQALAEYDAQRSEPGPVSGHPTPAQVEAVARAICRAYSEDQPEEAIECQVANGWDMWLPEAQAAIAALRASE
jgi:hypothetical protein